MTGPPEPEEFLRTGDIPAPGDLPECWVRSLSWWVEAATDPRTAGLMHQAGVNAETAGWLVGPGWELTRFWVLDGTAGPLFDAMWPSVPEDITGAPELFGPPVAVVLFPHPVEVVTVDTGRPILQVGMLVVRGRPVEAADRPGWAVVTLCSMRFPEGLMLMPSGSSIWPDGDPLGRVPGYVDPTHPSRSPAGEASYRLDRQMLVTVGTLIGDPGLLVPEPVPGARARARRLRRMRPGPRNPDGTVVRWVPGTPTDPTAPEPPGEPAAGAGAHVDRRLRWRVPVRGHWRSQPYGPGRALRRPMWIRAHIRGPRDAPVRDPARVVRVLGVRHQPPPPPAGTTPDTDH